MWGRNDSIAGPARNEAVSDILRLGWFKRYRERSELKINTNCKTKDSYSDSTPVNIFGRFNLGATLRVATWFIVGTGVWLLSNGYWNIPRIIPC